MVLRLLFLLAALAVAQPNSEKMLFLIFNLLALNWIAKKIIITMLLFRHLAQKLKF